MKPVLSFKNIFITLIIIILGLIVAHRYNEHRKYDDIARFDYLPNDTIDYSYYDQHIVSTYLANCSRLSTLAKAIWLKGGIDIHKELTGFGETQSKIGQYNALLKYTKILEALLTESSDLKSQGLDNDVIKIIQENDMTPGAVENEKDKAAAYEFLRGRNVSSHSPPNEIWEVQKLLNNDDYNITISGVFDSATDSALMDFKASNNLYPSHVCDDMTLRKLAE